MDEGSLGVHQVELVVQPGPGLGDGRGVGEHADGPGHFGEVASRDNSRRLVVDANLESCGAPVHELDAAFCLDGGDGGVDVLGDHVSSVQEAAGHVLAVPGVALHHLVGGLEAGVSYLRHRQLFVICLLRRNDGGVSYLTWRFWWSQTLQ